MVRTLASANDIVSIFQPRRLTKGGQNVGNRYLQCQDREHGLDLHGAHPSGRKRDPGDRPLTPRRVVTSQVHQPRGGTCDCFLTSSSEGAVSTAGEGRPRDQTLRGPGGQLVSAHVSTEGCGSTQSLSSQAEAEA